jgi:hypothetical protein
MDGSPGRVVCGAFTTWLLVTSLLCLDPSEAAPHLYGAHAADAGQAVSASQAPTAPVIEAPTPDSTCEDGLTAMLVDHSDRTSAHNPRGGRADMASVVSLPQGLRPGPSHASESPPHLSGLSVLRI